MPCGSADDVGPSPKAQLDHTRDETIKARGGQPPDQEGKAGDTRCSVTMLSCLASAESRNTSRGNDCQSTRGGASAPTTDLATSQSVWLRYGRKEESYRRRTTNGVASDPYVNNVGPSECVAEQLRTKVRRKNLLMSASFAIQRMPLELHT